MNNENSGKAQRQGEFIRSVDRLSPSDIQSNEKKQDFMSLLLDNSRSIMLFFCCAVLIFSTIYVGNAITHYVKASDVYSNAAGIINGGNSAINQMYSPNTPISTPDYSESQLLTKEDIEDISSTGTVNKDFERIRSRLISLKSQYPNLYGWITIPGTTIDLPVMHTTNNDYYLNHSYTGQYVSSGAIFVDYNCDSILDRNNNLVVYGHHMVYGGMFSPLDKFLSSKFFNKNNTIIFYTVDAMYTYKIFSVYATDKYDPYIRNSFPSKASFYKFCTQRQNFSIHDTRDQIKLKEGDKIITLSTCTNRVADGRIAVHGVLTSKVL